MAHDRGLLAPGQVDSFTATHTNWRREGAALVSRLEFPDFSSAMGFILRVAFLAERHDHHPDIDIRFKRVTLSLSTHDMGGITGMDTLVAAEIDKL